MATYESNPVCRCSRCVSRGVVWPVFLITLGVLFLLSEFHIVGFHRTWPILLIVLGVTSVLGSTAAHSGHVDPHAPCCGPMPPSPPPEKPDDAHKQVEHV